MIRRLFGLGALASFGVCLAVPVLYFVGVMGEGGYKLAFNLASAGWFVSAPLWLTKKKKNEPTA